MKWTIDYTVIGLLIVTFPLLLLSLKIKATREKFMDQMGDRNPVMSNQELRSKIESSMPPEVMARRRPGGPGGPGGPPPGGPPGGPGGAGGGPGPLPPLRMPPDDDIPTRPPPLPSPIQEQEPEWSKKIPRPSGLVRPRGPNGLGAPPVNMGQMNMGQMNMGQMNMGRR